MQPHTMSGNYYNSRGSFRGARGGGSSGLNSNPNGSNNPNGKHYENSSQHHSHYYNPRGSMRGGRGNYYYHNNHHGHHQGYNSSYRRPYGGSSSRGGYHPYNSAGPGSANPNAMTTTANTKQSPYPDYKGPKNNEPSNTNQDDIETYEQQQQRFNEYMDEDVKVELKFSEDISRTENKYPPAEREGFVASNNRKSASPNPSPSFNKSPISTSTTAPPAPTTTTSSMATNQTKEVTSETKPATNGTGPNNQRATGSSEEDSKGKYVNPAGSSVDPIISSDKTQDPNSGSADAPFSHGDRYGYNNYEQGNGYNDYYSRPYRGSFRGGSYRGSFRGSFRGGYNSYHYYDDRRADYSRYPSNDYGSYNNNNNTNSNIGPVNGTRLNNNNNNNNNNNSIDRSRSSSSTPTFIKKEGSEEFSENGAAMTNNSPNPHPSQQKYHASSSSQPPYSYQNSHYSNETQGYPKRDSQGSAPPYNRYNSRDKSFSYDQQNLSVKEPNTDSTTNQQSNIPEYDMKCNHWVSTLKLSGDLKESTNKLFEELDSVNKNINELYQKSFNLEIEVEKFGRLSRTENLKSRLTDEKLESINFV
ncbi:hypothetical protein B5S28_g3654 [[Candida] boidinii]|nr:hypothetical protein B5S28_g3654 [[Candida] boidinii]OWB78217.1 hypothetical protein B5S32_g2405 [[Candida] boidinii]